MSELLPINPSLSDPALQYSDQYMELAMVPPIVNQIKQNADDIEELKEGGGGGGGILLAIATYDYDTHMATLNKTVNEIATALETSCVVVKITFRNGADLYYYPIVYAFLTDGDGHTDPQYSFVIYDSNAGDYIEFSATSRDAYPEAYWGD